MNEVITEKVKAGAKKHKKLYKKPQVDAVVAEEPKSATLQEQASVIPESMMPSNWEMSTDAMIKLQDDITYVDERLVVKNSGFKSPQNEPIGESDMESVLVKSNIKFATVVNAGKNTTYSAGDVVAVALNGIKIIDFAKSFAVVPHYSIYGKIRNTGTQDSKPGSKNLLGRILKGIGKRLGLRNVLK